jgi:hypothetical protein
MRRYLVIANVTVTEPHLLDKVRQAMAAGDSSFHLLIPASPSHEGLTWTEGQARAAAQEQLDAGLRAFGDMGAEVTGEVGAASPVDAAGDLVAREDFDEILLSTLPLGPSRWLKQDVVARMQRHVNIPVTHVLGVASESPAG